jgi:hypothetical protein
VSKHKLKERASMGEATIIGLGLAKDVFQLHGAASDGSVVFRKKLSRLRFARYMAVPRWLLRRRPAPSFRVTSIGVVDERGRAAKEGARSRPDRLRRDYGGFAQREMADILGKTENVRRQYLSLRHPTG